MNMLHKCARSIAERGKGQGWKPGTKTADLLNLEAWIGAWLALDNAGHPEAGHVGGYVTMVICVRGYSETLHLAAKADEEAA